MLCPPIGGHAAARIGTAPVPHAGLARDVRVVVVPLILGGGTAADRSHRRQTQRDPTMRPVSAAYTAPFPARITVIHGRALRLSLQQWQDGAPSATKAGP